MNFLWLATETLIVFYGRQARGFAIDRRPAAHAERNEHQLERKGSHERLLRGAYLWETCASHRSVRWIEFPERAAIERA